MADAGSGSSSSSHRRRQLYPFAAIVGQDDLKLCLILCAIDPSIGGVLIQGGKGTAKSTAARGIAHLMPQIEVGYDPVSGSLDPYNRRPCTEGGEDNDGDDKGPLHNESRFIETPFVDLPIGSTEDRVIGSIDFSATLKQGGKRVFAPGLLAAANRGVLYVDEVNLLPAHLVDVLLDAAASGINTIQREGLAMSHPSRFMLIGTMNPEEGDLRPQLLDRFGLMVDVSAPQDAAERSEVVRCAIHFERDEATFLEKWHGTERELAQKISEAKGRLPNVVLSDGLLLLISRICTEFQVGSLRADITLYKTATALAAWKGRLAVEAEDIRQAAEWVLAHRRRRQPFEQPTGGPQTQEKLDQIMNDNANASQPPRSREQDEMKENGTSNEDSRQGEEPTDNTTSSDDNKTDASSSKREENSDKGGSDDMQTFTASKPGQIKQLRLGTQQLKKNQPPGTGRRNPIQDTQQKGHYVRSMQTDKPVDLALDATLRAAAVNGLSETGQPIIHPDNWRRKVRNSTSDTLILFVVDASGSMSARKRMETVKGSVLALLTDAYQQRDRVGVIAFRGVKAEVLLEPTKSVELAEKQLQRLPTGGRTPLAHALSLTYSTIRRIRNEPDQSILLIVLSDGKANVPLPESEAGSDAWIQTEQAAGQLATLELPTLMLDTDSGGLVRVGRGKELAHLLKADYMELDDLSSDGLIHTIRQATD